MERFFGGLLIVIGVLAVPLTVSVAMSDWREWQRRRRLQRFIDAVMGTPTPLHDDTPPPRRAALYQSPDPHARADASANRRAGTAPHRSR